MTRFQPRLAEMFAAMDWAMNLCLSMDGWPQQKWPYWELLYLWSPR